MVSAAARKLVMTERVLKARFGVSSAAKMQ